MNHRTLLQNTALRQNKSIAPIQMSIVRKKSELNTVPVQYNLKETKEGIHARLATRSILKFTIRSKMLTVTRL